MSAPDVQDRLQQALGDVYVIERELGGGGMSRIFVAEDGALGRKVVVKVLRAELADSGRYEVYLRSMTGQRGRVQVSTNGAVEPLWSPTGKELFYRADRKIIASRITWSGGAARVQREPLFDDVYVSNGSAHVTYSVMPDGNHFVFLQSAGGEPKTIVTLNWFEEVRRRMAAAAAR